VTKTRYGVRRLRHSARWAPARSEADSEAARGESYATSARATPAATKGKRLGRGLGLATDRKEARIGVISQPWTQLVCATEPLNASCPGIKHPRGIFRRLDSPVGHAKWPRGDRQSVATREAKRGVRSLEGVCCIDTGLGSFCDRGRRERRCLRGRGCRCTYRGGVDRQARVLEKTPTPHPHGGRCANFTHSVSIADEPETGIQSHLLATVRHRSPGAPDYVRKRKERVRRFC